MQAPEQPKRRGRKPLPEDQGKTARIELRTTPELRDKADQLAERSGLSRNEWIERQIERARA